MECIRKPLEAVKGASTQHYSNRPTRKAKPPCPESEFFEPELFAG